MNSNFFSPKFHISIILWKCAKILNLNFTKELSLYRHKLWVSTFYIDATQCRRPKIFQTLNSVQSNNLSFKYHWFTPSGCTDLGIKNMSLRLRLKFFFLKSHVNKVCVNCNVRFRTVPLKLNLIDNVVFKD